MILVLVWIPCLVFAIIIGSNKGQPLLGFFLGFFLGPLGVLIACLIPEKKAEYVPTRRSYTHYAEQRTEDATEDWLNKL